MLQGWIQIIVFCLVLIAIVPLLGGYMARVFSERTAAPRRRLPPCASTPSADLEGLRRLA